MITIKLQDEPNTCISNHDVAALAEWAAKQKYLHESREISKAFAMIREGADLLLRRRNLLSLNQEQRGEGK